MDDVMVFDEDLPIATSSPLDNSKAARTMKCRIVKDSVIGNMPILTGVFPGADGHQVNEIRRFTCTSASMIDRMCTIIG